VLCVRYGRNWERDMKDVLCVRYGRNWERDMKDVLCVRYVSSSYGWRRRSTAAGYCGTFVCSRRPAAEFLTNIVKCLKFT